MMWWNPPFSVLLVAKIFLKFQLLTGLTERSGRDQGRVRDQGRATAMQCGGSSQIVTNLFDREAAVTRSRTCETILTDVRFCDSPREQLTPRAFEGGDGGGGGGLTSAACDLNGSPPADLEDLRMCWIEFDADGKLRKPWRKVLGEGSVEMYQDSLVTGETQAPFWARHVFPNGGRPSVWLREWARDLR